MIYRRLETVRGSFIKGLPDRVAELLDLWRRAVKTGMGSGLWAEAREAARAIADGAAAHAFAAIDAIARSIAFLIEEHGERDTVSPAPEDVARVEGLLNQLLRATFQAEDDHAEAQPQESLPPVAPRQGPRPVMLLTREEPARELLVELGLYGYPILVFARLAALRDAMRSGPPAAVIVDILFPDGELCRQNVVDELRGASSEPPLILFLSPRDDLEARLHAARLGGAGYLTHPVNVPAMVDVLESHAASRSSGSVRVLIVAGEGAQAHEKTLREAGMLTRVVASTDGLMEAVATFKPDLVVIEVHVERSDGIHLATAIRQQAELAVIPILFLGKPADAAVLSATSFAADGFLAEPFDPPALVESATRWSVRYRTLRSAMGRDSLTGLLSRRGILEHLDIELARAYRAMEPLAFVRLDIDGLKTINERHGVIAGDDAIQGLARLLRGRLRRTDILGRYTGGRFALILPGTPGDAAAKVLNELRSTYAKLRHGSDGPTATFSAGIAVYPHYRDALTLQEAADRALREAKDAGGDRVTSRSERGARGRRVLVIDDDAQITEMLQTKLEHGGYEVISAYNGQRGLDLAVQEKPDLIISDLLLPYVNGFDLCRKVKEDPALAHIPVVLITAVYRKYMYRVEAKRVGAAELFEKPLPLHTLMSLVEEQLATAPRLFPEAPTEPRP